METGSGRDKTGSGRDETGSGWKGRITDARDGRQTRHIAGQTKVTHAIRGVHLNMKQKTAIGYVQIGGSSSPQIYRYLDLLAVCQDQSCGPHHYDADPNPVCHSDADPDPTVRFDADPNPDPSVHIEAQKP